MPMNDYQEWKDNNKPEVIEKIYDCCTCCSPGMRFRHDHKAPCPRCDFRQPETVRLDK